MNLSSVVDAPIQNLLELSDPEIVKAMMEYPCDSVPSEIVAEMKARGFRFNPDYSIVTPSGLKLKYPERTCGAPETSTAPTPGFLDDVARDVPTYLIPSLVSIIFCGLFGIIATISALFTIRAKNRGSHEDAVKCSNHTRIWMILAYVVGIISLIQSWRWRY